MDNEFITKIDEKTNHVIELINDLNIDNSDKVKVRSAFSDLLFIILNAYIQTVCN